MENNSQPKTNTPKDEESTTAQYPTKNEYVDLVIDRLRTDGFLSVSAGDIEHVGSIIRQFHKHVEDVLTETLPDQFRKEEE